MKYFTHYRTVYLGFGPKSSDAKEICTAKSVRLAGKIASHLNAMEGGTDKRREYFMRGEGNPKRRAPKTKSKVD